MLHELPIPCSAYKNSYNCPIKIEPSVVTPEIEVDIYPGKSKMRLILACLLFIGICMTVSTRFPYGKANRDKQYYGYGG